MKIDPRRGTKIAAMASRMSVGAIVACACLAGGAEPVRDLPFPLVSVRLAGGPLQAQQEQNRRYLLRLELDRLLSRFRSEAGLKPKAEPYNGWEAPDGRLDLAGHILNLEDPSVYVLLYMLDCVAQQASTSGLRISTTSMSSLRRGSG